MEAVDLFRIPEYCPACSGATSVVGDFLFCQNRSCPAKLSGAVRVWVRNLGLLHWGDALIDALTDPESPRIRSVADLYRLTVEEIAECCSGLKVARKCYEVLHSNKELPLELVLASLNIPNFGTSTATDLVQAGFDTVDKVLGADFDALCSVPNIGEKTARQVQEGLLSRRDVILDLQSVLTVRRPTVSGPLAGKSVCITGELSRPRKAVEKDIMDAGGFPKGSVTKATAYLVTNYPGTNSSKMQAARRHGIPVIGESELYELILGASRSS